jgi:glycosyltransferase involved in cell wall biosynthesis
MEQTLGHVTHATNLAAAVAEQDVIRATWLPVPFDVAGAERLVPGFNSNWSIRASWRARRALGKAVAARPHDALLFHTQVTALFSVGLMRRYPSIVSLDATPFNYDSVGLAYGHAPAGDGLLDRHKFQLNRRVFQAAVRVVAWSDWARRSLIEDYGVDPARIVVLAPGAAPAYFELGQHRMQGGEHPVASPVRLLFVGGDFERKGGTVLLEALGGELGERCELHVVTQAPVEPRPNVHVHRGLAPNSAELRRLFAEADVFVLPSRGECLAIALMEATAAGLPVVTTAIGALPEAVLPDVSGLVVPADDAAALRAAVAVLVADPARRVRMGRAGHRLAHARFNAQRNNRYLLGLLAESGSTDRRTA